MSHAHSTWSTTGTVTSAVYADVSGTACQRSFLLLNRRDQVKDCASTGQNVAATTWVQYMSRALRTHTMMEVAGGKRCQTFRMNSVEWLHLVAAPWLIRTTYYSG